MIEDKVINVKGKDIAVTIITAEDQPIHYFTAIDNKVDNEPVCVMPGQVSITNAKSAEVKGVIFTASDEKQLATELSKAKYIVSESVSKWKDEKSKTKIISNETP